jgi:hypothetical protein
MTDPREPATQTHVMADTRRPLSFFTDFLLGLHPRTHPLCRSDALSGTIGVGGTHNHCIGGWAERGIRALATCCAKKTAETYCRNWRVRFAVRLWTPVPRAGVSAGVRAQGQYTGVVRTGSALTNS